MRRRSKSGQSVLKEFVRYCSLNVLGMLGLSGYIFADTFFVAQGLGADGIAALNLAIPIYSIIHGCGLMLGIGGATKFSVLGGRGKAANEVFSSAASMAAILAALFVIAGLLLSEPLTKLLGANADVFGMTNTYLKVLLLFAPAFLMNNLQLCFVRNDGNPKLSMLAMLFGSLSNIVLDYLFIFPLQMGMFGAVFATGLAPVISICILSPHLLRKKCGFRLQKAGLCLKNTASVFSLGFPSLVTEVASGVVMVVFNTLLLRLQGNTGVAAYAIIANLSLIVAAVYTGIAQGAQPLLSRAYGAGAHRQARQVMRYACFTAAVVSAALYLGIFFFAAPLVGLFNGENNSLLQQIASYGLKLYFTAIPFVGFNIVASIYFTSIQRPGPAHVISLLRGVIVIIPMAYTLAAAAGLTGVWLAFPVTEGLVAAIGAICYFKYSVLGAAEVLQE